MVPAVADVGAHLSPAAAGGLHGVGAEEPVRDVQGMNVLLDNDVAGEGLVEDPVPQPRHLRTGGRLAAEPAGEVTGPSQERLADEAGEQFPRGPLVERIHARLEVHPAAELVFHLVGRRDDGQRPGTSTATGLAR